jgi:hypothetical protein
MLMHQFILVAVGTLKRFESVLLSIPQTLRRMTSREDVGGSDLQEPETEQAA